MPTTVKMRPNETMHPRVKKSLYMTRRMMAADESGAIDVGPREAKLLSRAGWADDVSDAPAPKRRGRPPKAKAEPQAEPHDQLEEKTVLELREMAEEKGVELPSGYVRKDELVEMISDEDDR